VRFLPTDEGFFGLFDQLAERLTTASRLLAELSADPARRDDLIGRIKAEEHAADTLTYEVMQRIDRSFVTPLDREDIHLLATRLDTVVDLIDGTARRIQMFNVTDRRDEAVTLTGILCECAESIAKAVKLVRSPSAVHRIARQVKELEEKADAAYAAAIQQLFSGTPDAIEVIKWKEIFDNLEHAVDECEDVANVLESISLKNS
jgi:uncharacterized protein